MELLTESLRAGTMAPKKAMASQRAGTMAPKKAMASQRAG